MNLEQTGRSKMHLIINTECESYDVRMITFEFIRYVVREDFLVTVKINNNIFFSNNIKQKYV